MFRKDLAHASQKELWKSYDAIINSAENSAEIEEIIQREFPVNASQFSDPISRRHFFKIMSASLALAGITACKFSPASKIVGFVKGPEGMIPGKSHYYARSLNRGPFAIGVLVESFMGRPIKIEGNPEHPMSLGATDAFLQAEILNLYDQDRLQFPIKKNEKLSWANFKKEWKERAIFHQADNGSGLRLLINKHSSESFNAQTLQLLKRFPKAKIITHDPLENNLEKATLLAFGKALLPLYNFSKAQVILSIDRDFFSDQASGIRYSRDFADKRRLTHSKNQKMNRLYAIESDHTNTGSMADHRLARSRAEIEKLIIHMALKLGINLKSDFVAYPISKEENNWLNSVIKDLKDNSGSSLIIANENLRPNFQALIFAMNNKLGNIDSTINFYKATKRGPSLYSLIEEINHGAISSLIIMGLNPVYTTAKNLAFSEALKKIAFSVSLTPIENETSKECLWTLPESHPLESWSDARAINGLLSINQPLINPLFDSMSAIELLSILANDKKTEGHDLVKNYWATQNNPLNFDHWWESALSYGLVINSKYPKEKVRLQKNVWTIDPDKNSTQKNGEYLELHFRPDPTIGDGSYANNGWLQELPKPMTKLTWSNAALISPALARSHDLQNGSVITITPSYSFFKDNNLSAPVWILPGLSKNIIVIHYGHGRRLAGRVGTQSGFNAYQLLHSKMEDDVQRGISIKITGEIRELACTQQHHSFEDREPIKIHPINKYQTLKKEIEFPRSFYTEPPVPQSTDYAWGMSIDLNVCTGCNACVIGCQAENNIPIVGEAEVIRGREMHWLRIDRYFEGAPDFAKAYFQPLACVHCEKAPCEVVCPVAATVHSNEGINEMIYNRCVGTRYCSNNCPYKVRRFNFLEYHQRENELLKMRSNPDVTVRSRGVMEKCTYCIQRINEKRVEAEIAGRKILDGEIKTACQQACATKAIVFGNLRDPKSQVSKLHSQVQSYELLGELATIPRTQYLARFVNTNPEIKA